MTDGTETATTEVKKERIGCPVALLARPKDMDFEAYKLDQAILTIQIRQYCKGHTYWDIETQGNYDIGRRKQKNLMKMMKKMKKH